MVVRGGCAIDEASDKRWRKLFGDLEGQFEAEFQRETATELVDRVRYERGQLAFTDRLRASIEREVRIGVRGRSPVGGTVDEVGPDWVLVGGPVGDLLIATSGIVWIEGLHHVGLPAAGPQWAVPDLRRVVRELTQSRSAVAVGLADGLVLNGTFAGVFADHADLACHAPLEPARREAITAVVTIPFSELVTIRRFR